MKTLIHTINKMIDTVIEMLTPHRSDGCECEYCGSGVREVKCWICGRGE